MYITVCSEKPVYITETVKVNLLNPLFLPQFSGIIKITYNASIRNKGLSVMAAAHNDLLPVACKMYTKNLKLSLNCHTASCSIILVFAYNNY